MKEKIQQVYNNLNNLNIPSSKSNCSLLLQSMYLLQEIYDELLENEITESEKEGDNIGN